MQEITVRIMVKADEAAMNMKNEPFRLFGRMIPAYQDGNWSYTTEKYEEESWDLFPDEPYNFDEMKDEYVFFGAYADGECVGLAVVKHNWNKYMYLHDLKVKSEFRGRHAATKMLDAAFNYAREHDYRGIWTIGQDNNLGACLFYVNSGFRIGGLDTEGYTGTKQEGKRDIFFYRG